MDASLHQMEHLVPDRGQVQLMGNVELSTVVDPINAPVRFQWVYISYGARLPSNSGSTSHMQLGYPQTVPKCGPLQSNCRISMSVDYCMIIGPEERILVRIPPPP